CQNPQEVADNCTYVANPDQANCNAEAENARGVPAWGDACDPVPCPNSSAAALDQANSTGGCSGGPHIALLCTGRHVHDIIHTDTVGSHVSEAIVELTGQPVLGQPAAYGVDRITTDSRFCQSNLHLPQPVNCHAAQVIGDGELTFWPTASSEEGIVPAHPWHRITLSRTAGGRGGTWQADYGLTPTDQTWGFESDNTFWSSVNPPRIPAPD